jgi:hypothetical protein
MYQDIVNIKTMLLKLKRVLQEVGLNTLLLWQVQISTFIKMAEKSFEGLAIVALLPYKKSYGHYPVELFPSFVFCFSPLATDPGVRVRFPALPDFLRSSRSGTGSIQPREYN